MADNDQSINNLRYNQITQGLEGFGGGSPMWTPLALVADGGINQLHGDVMAGPGAGNQAATIAAGAVTATKIAPGTITNTQISTSAAIAFTKMAAQPSDTVMVSDGSGFIVGGGASATEINYLAGVTSAIQTQLDGKLTTALADTNIFVGNNSSLAVAVPLSGDATLDNTGALTLATVNSNVGSFTAANITVDAKGRITAAANGSGASPGGNATDIQVNDGSGGFTGSDDLIFNNPSHSQLRVHASGNFATVDIASDAFSNINFLSADTSINRGFIYFSPTLSQIVSSTPGVDLQVYVNNSASSQLWTFAIDGVFTTPGPVGIQSSPDPSAALDVTSTSSGFLPPRMTTVQRTAIPSPAAGLIVYDTNLGKLTVYTTQWEAITSAGPV